MSKRALKPGWKMVKFGDVVRQCKESVDRENNPFERYVEGGHMDSENIHIRRWGEFGEDYVGPAFHRIFRKGQVLYGSRRTYLKKIALAEFDGITANTTFVLETKNQKIFLQELLPFLMLTDSFTEHSIRESKGSTNPYINWPDIAKYEFPLPPLEEQKRMAEILWAADEAVERWTSVAEVLSETIFITSNNHFKKSLVFTPNKKTISSLTNIVEIDPKISEEITDETLVSFISMEDISEHGGVKNVTYKTYGETKKGYTYFSNGDILFAKITPCMENFKGALVTDIKTDIGMGSTEFFVFRPYNTSDRLYVYYLSLTPLFRFFAERWMQGSAGHRRVPKDFFSNFKIMLPSIDKRNAFANRLGQLHRTKIFASNHLSNAKQMLKKIINFYLY